MRKDKHVTVGNEGVVAAEEDFLVSVQHAIQWLLNDRGLTQADLASRLGISEARVSQMFGSKATNLTIKTIARIFYVLNDKCEITSGRLEELKAAVAGTWDTRTKWIYSDRPLATHGQGKNTREIVDKEWANVVPRQSPLKFVNDNGCQWRGGYNETRAA